MDAVSSLLLAATVSVSIAAGATLDQTFKQLPARHRIGAGAYAEYARAADLSNGLVWYPIMGISTTLLSATAIVTGLLTRPTATTTAALIIMAVGTAGFTAATAKAAPTLLGLRQGEITDAMAKDTLDRFARFNALRTAAITITLVASTWALASSVN